MATPAAQAPGSAQTQEFEPPTRITSDELARLAEQLGISGQEEQSTLQIDGPAA